MWETKTEWYHDEIKKKGMKVQKPSPELEAGFSKIGEQLTADWLKRAGAEGQAVVDAYKKSFVGHRPSSGFDARRRYDCKDARPLRRASAFAVRKAAEASPLPTPAPPVLRTFCRVSRPAAWGHFPRRPTKFGFPNNRTSNG